MARARYSCAAERKFIEIGDTYMEKALNAYMQLMYEQENKLRMAYNRALKLKHENAALRARQRLDNRQVPVNPFFEKKRSN